MPEHSTRRDGDAEGLMEKGRLGGGVLQVDDIRATYEELMKDNSNNWFSMTQPK